MRTDVVFLSAPDAIHLYYGSTFLRGMQLTELLAAHRYLYLAIIGIHAWRMRRLDRRYRERA